MCCGILKFENQQIWKIIRLRVLKIILSNSPEEEKNTDKLKNLFVRP